MRLGAKDKKLLKVIIKSLIDTSLYVTVAVMLMSIALLIFQHPTVC